VTDLLWTSCDTHSHDCRDAVIRSTLCARGFGRPGWPESAGTRASQAPWQPRNVGRADSVVFVSPIHYQSDCFARAWIKVAAETTRKGGNREIRACRSRGKPLIPVCMRNRIISDWVISCRKDYSPWVSARLRYHISKGYTSLLAASTTVPVSADERQGEYFISRLIASPPTRPRADGTAQGVYPNTQKQTWCVLLRIGGTLFSWDAFPLSCARGKCPPARVSRRHADRAFQSAPYGIRLRVSVRRMILDLQP
jgi:hypothetical protein